MRKVLFSLLLLVAPAAAHDSLYNAAEIHFAAPGSATVYFSVHAPELMEVANPDEANDEWLASLDDRMLTDLIKRASAWIQKNFKLEPGSVESLHVESPEEIRSPDRDQAARPGCLLASLPLKFEPQLRSLRLSYGAEAGKRLLFVVIVPRSFPKTHDLAPGDSLEIPVPITP